MVGKKICYYELLGLDRKCEAAEIKSAYRKLALKMHPDKAHVNALSVEEATKQFQQIQEAYSVLSDQNERAWYDAHREQILRGDDEAGEDPFKTKINLYKYCSSGCYDGFGNGPTGFFAVYTELFESIDSEEAEWEDADDEHTPMPPFGKSDSEWADVAQFYRHWNDFCSRKAFGHADKWKPQDAPNRQVKRAMEQENKKARQAAKKDFNAEVRQLVRFVEKRDPRVEAHQKQKLKDSVEKKQQDLAQKHEAKAAETQEKKDRAEAARRAEEERWAEVQAQKEAQRARGENVSEDASSDSDSEIVEYCCEPCRKSFKSEKQFDQHVKTKKHLQIVAKLRRELDLEIAAEAAAKAEVEDDEEDDLEKGACQSSSEEESTQVVQQHVGGENGSKNEEEQDDDDDDDEDAMLARFASFRPQDEVNDVAGNSSSSDSDADNETGALGGKKAQKRLKQRAILLEKKAQKDSVEELVNSCRKAQRAERQGEGPPEEQDEAAIAADAGAQAKTAVPKKKKKAAAAVASAESTQRCNVCGEEFSSRSKMFQHIQATGHAALKGQAPEPAKGGKKKR